MEKKSNNYQNIAIKNLDHSEIEIEGEITIDALQKSRKMALERLGNEVKIPGFRTGHIPENVLVSHLGEVSILMESGEVALNQEYGNILEEHKIKAIGQPEITITKIAPGNPMGFKIKTAVMPEVTLPSYKKIAKDENAKKEDAAKVEQKEIDDVLKEIKKQRAGQEKKKEEEIELNDEYVKTLGDFTSLDDFTKKIEENILAEKQSKLKEKKRLAIVEKLIAESKIDLPEMIVQSELDRMIAQLKEDIMRAGLTYESYLIQIKKTDEDIRKEWRAHAEQKAKLQFILRDIAREEKIEPEEEAVKKEMEHIMSHFKDADRFQVRMYVENMLRNEKVFTFLEEQK
jgi:FKBP-type peptidyl-prolyl cis-trans isomerase (trigger factor)